MSGVNSAGGVGNQFDLATLFQSMSDKVNARGTKLQEEIQAMSQMDKVEAKDLLPIQFNMGQYNLMMETTSSIVKASMDTMKTLSQRTA